MATPALGYGTLRTQLNLVSLCVSVYPVLVHEDSLAIHADCRWKEEIDPVVSRNEEASREPHKRSLGSARHCRHRLLIHRAWVDEPGSLRLFGDRGGIMEDPDVVEPG